MEYLQMAFAEDRLGQLRAQASQERLARQIRGGARRLPWSGWAGWSLSDLRVRVRTHEPAAPCGAACSA